MQYFLNFEQCIKGLKNDKISVATIFHRILTSWIINDNYGGCKALTNLLIKHPKAGLAFCRFSSTTAKIICKYSIRNVSGLTVVRICFLIRVLIKYLLKQNFGSPNSIGMIKSKRKIFIKKEKKCVRIIEGIVNLMKSLLPICKCNFMVNKLMKYICEKFRLEKLTNISHNEFF